MPPPPRGSSEGRWARTERVVAAARRYLFEERGFRLFAMERDTVYEHPGVYVMPSTVYVSRVLISKGGSAPSLALILDGVLKRVALLSAGDGDAPLLAVKVDAADWSALPSCTIVPVSAVAPTLVNATPVDVLVQQQLLLKLAFWPFGWDSSGARGSVMRSFGAGFADAARAAIARLEKKSEYLDAISRAAAHRLKRGIWTTTGGGDLTRCIAACERLCGIIDECDTDALGEDDRLVAARDLAVLYCHAGRRVESIDLLRAACAEGRRGDGLAEDIERKVSLQLLDALESSADCTDAFAQSESYTELPW